MTLAHELAAAADRAGLPLPPGLAEACATHHALLVRWNRTHNLTRVTDATEAATRHYLDCLWPALATPEAERRDAVDIGSGAGFPGLIVALAWPTHAFLLVEPAHKRQSFLRLAIAELKVGDRVRVAAPPAAPAALVLSRATFSPGERAPLAAAVAPGGILWLWSVPAEVGPWDREAASLGLRAIAPLERSLDGEPRVILRAER